MKTPEQKYNNDPQYRACVDMMEKMIHDAMFTPSEMREMAMLASTHFEMCRTQSYMRLWSQRYDSWLTRSETERKS